MPKTRGGRRAGDSDVPSFLKVELTDDVEAHFEHWLADLEEGQVWEWLTTEHTRPLDLRVTFSNNAWCAMLLDRDREAAGKSFILSAWSDERTEAVELLMYKDRVMLQEDWDNAEPSQAKRSARR